VMKPARTPTADAAQGSTKPARGVIMTRPPIIPPIVAAGLQSPSALLARRSDTRPAREPAVAVLAMA